MVRKAVNPARRPSLVKAERSDLPLEFKDRGQVDLDLARVPLSKAAKAKLEHRVATVLSANPELSYYQGFHDVAMHSHSARQLESLALQQLRDFMAPSMQPTQQILALIPELLNAADPNGIGQHFAPRAGDDQRALLGYFAVAPVVTLFSHDTDDSRVIMPIIRTVLKEGLSYVLYLYVALLLENPQLFLTAGKQVDSDEIDMALAGAGALLTYDNFATVDKRARRLRSRYPLRTLPAFKRISRHSVLKTGKITKRSTALYTLGQLDSNPESPQLSLSSRASSRLAVMVVAVGAVAVSMLWSRAASHR